MNGPLAGGGLFVESLSSGVLGGTGGLKVGAVGLGDVPFRWATEGDVLKIDGVEARPLGGKLSAWATIPLRGEGPIEGKATLTGLDVAGDASDQLSAQIALLVLRLGGHPVLRVMDARVATGSP